LVAYQISTTLLDPITGRTHQEELDHLASVGSWAAFYQKVHEFTAFQDDNGNYADSNVREWFSVAAQANAGTGAPAALIREYTAAQVSLRLGQTVSSETMQDASDAIAASIAANYISNGTLPSLADIRNFDATNVVSVLQNADHNV